MVLIKSMNYSGLSLLTNFILHTLQKYVNAFISAIKMQKRNK